MVVVEHRPLRRRDATPTQGAHHLVRGDRPLVAPDQLGQPTGGHVPAQVHQEEPVLRVHVALGTEQVGRACPRRSSAPRGRRAAPGPSHRDRATSRCRPGAGSGRRTSASPMPATPPSRHHEGSDHGEDTGRTSSGHGARLTAERIDRRTPVPTYSYACTACGHRFDAQQSFTDDALTQCPQCARSAAQAVRQRGRGVQGLGVLPQRRAQRAGEVGHGRRPRRRRPPPRVGAATRVGRTVAPASSEGTGGRASPAGRVRRAGPVSRAGPVRRARAGPGPGPPGRGSSSGPGPRPAAAPAG